MVGDRGRINAIERGATRGKVAIVLTQGFADREYAHVAGAGGPFHGPGVESFL